MASWVAALLALPALPLVIVGLALVFTSPSGSDRQARGDGLLAIGLAMSCISNLLAGDWPLAAVTGLGAAVSALLWWNGRRKRKDRAAKAMGAKSRARLAELVRKAREAAKPRPVLRPVPGGVS